MASLFVTIFCVVVALLVLASAGVAAVTIAQQSSERQPGRPFWE